MGNLILIKVEIALQNGSFSAIFPRTSGMVPDVLHHNQITRQIESSKDPIMKDKNGLYYFPFPDNKRVRMYVQDEDGVICFRLWSADDTELWATHGWMPYRAILEASQMNTQKHFDPKQAYDIRVARELLEESRK